MNDDIKSKAWFAYCESGDIDSMLHKYGVEKSVIDTIIHHLCKIDYKSDFELLKAHLPQETVKKLQTNLRVRTHAVNKSLVTIKLSKRSHERLLIAKKVMHAASYDEIVDYLTDDRFRQEILEDVGKNAELQSLRNNSTEETLREIYIGLQGLYRREFGHLFYNAFYPSIYQMAKKSAHVCRTQETKKLMKLAARDVSELWGLSFGKQNVKLFPRCQFIEGFDELISNNERMSFPDHEWILAIEKTADVLNKDNLWILKNKIYMISNNTNYGYLHSKVGF